MRIKFLTERPFGEKVRKWLISQGETIVDKGQELTIICYYARILPQSEIDEAPTLNFHPGYLPMYRGMHPQYWALVEDGPYGVTLHWVSKEVDCGPIIAQKKYNVLPTFIASDMDRISQKTIFELFKKWWPRIKKGTAPKRRQKGPSSRHLMKDIQKIHEFDASIVRRMRANTFDDTSYAYFIDKGKRIKFGIKFYEDTC
jgi:methionyl-tRNA formyltransferase